MPVGAHVPVRRREPQLRPGAGAGAIEKWSASFRGERWRGLDRKPFTDRESSALNSSLPL